MNCEDCLAGFIERTKAGKLTYSICGCLANCPCDDGSVFVERDGYEFAQECPNCGATRGAVYRLNMARLPAKFIGALLATFEANTQAMNRAARRAEAIARTRGRVGAVFHGPVGTGKTHLLVAVLKSIAYAGTPVLFAHLGETIRELKRLMDEPEGGGAALLHRLYTVAVLGLDELQGLETNWQRQVTADILQARYNADLATLVTTNRGPADIAKELGDYGERVVSRLREMSPFVALSGPDWRTK